MERTRIMEIGPIKSQDMIFWPLANVFVEIDKGQQKIKLFSPTNKFTGFLPINFLPLLAPP